MLAMTKGALGLSLAGLCLLSCGRGELRERDAGAGIDAAGGSGPADAAEPRDASSSEDAGAGRGDAGSDVADAGPDRCGCYPPAQCNGAWDGCTFECARCDQSLRCPGDAGYCDYDPWYEAGACLYFMPNECPGSGSLPKVVDVERYWPFGCMVLERFGVTRSSNCQAHNLVDLERSEVVLSFRYQALDPDAGVTEVPLGSMAMTDDLRAAWQLAVNDGLWCQRSAPVTALGCGFDLPSVIVTVEGADAGHRFDYYEGGGTIPAEQVFKAIRSTFEYTQPRWLQFFWGPSDAGSEP
ncbi:MAG: hypothetical protein QM765_26670 [Myxococcales bacterium]